MIDVRCPNCNRRLFKIDNSSAVSGLEIKCNCKKMIKFDIITLDFIMNNNLTATRNSIIIK